VPSGATVPSRATDACAKLALGSKSTTTLSLEGQKN
jgi:hypothetical protein